MRTRQRTRLSLGRNQTADLIRSLEQWLSRGDLSAFVLCLSGHVAQFGWINEHAFGVKRRLVIISADVWQNLRSFSFDGSNVPIYNLDRLRAWINANYALEANELLDFWNIFLDVNRRLRQEKFRRRDFKLRYLYRHLCELVFHTAPPQYVCRGTLDYYKLANLFRPFVASVEREIARAERHILSGPI